MAIQQQSTKIISLSGQSLTEGQTELLELGLLLTPIPKFDLNFVKNDLFSIIHKLRLIYHITDVNANEINPHQSLLKPKSTWTPVFTEKQRIGKLIRN